MPSRCRICDAPLDKRSIEADACSVNLSDGGPSTSVFELFQQDAQRWVVPGEVAPRPDLTFRRVLALLYRHIPLRAMLWFRIGNWCQRRGIIGLPGIIQRHLYHRYGLDIVIGSEIAGGLYIAHPVGTVIAVDRIGRNCSIIASATLGLRNERAFPTIGDDVFVGAGARVLGGITIGDGARIGANAVVIHDVPAGATAIGIPARIVGAPEPAAGL
jgi:serine O-acetyltransferase